MTLDLPTLPASLRLAYRLPYPQEPGKDTGIEAREGCWHSSSGGSPSTLTITMLVSTAVGSTEQMGDASSWSPGPKSCGELSPTPELYSYPYHPGLVTQERQRAAQL